MKSTLAIHGGKKTVKNESVLKIEWPRITKRTKKAINKQLKDSISIYDKSGIFEEFERSFALLHNRKFALLSNSGTSAIFSMLEGINLRKEDEIISSVYTFHATISPVVYTGATPIFCDVDKQGNMSIDDLKKRVTKKTRAVIVTHMWGVPAKDIEEIASFCKEKNITLFEDCSHAHGAQINNKLVGTFGDAAAWSLQGQKTISGGEGGIMLADVAGIYERAVLQGHYNKRAKNEINSSSKEHDYFLTGLGLKLRAHPLAIAIANQQLGLLDEFMKQRGKFAAMYSKALISYPFIKLNHIEKKGTLSSWYAYIIRYDSSAAFDISREDFVKALIAEGLIDVDIPGSTGLLNELPLFTRTAEIMPRLYSNNMPKQSNFPNAKLFYDSIIKLPVFSYKDELKQTELYIKGIQKVCNHIMKYKSLHIPVG